MAERVGKGLDWLQRAQALGAALVALKLWLVPMISGIIGAYLAAREHVPLSQVYLFGLYGFAGGVLLLVGIRWLFRRPPIVQESAQRSARNSDQSQYDAKLEIRFATTGAYRLAHQQRTFIRFGVCNASDTVAKNVEVFLTEMEPVPACFDPDFPYRVRRSDSSAEVGNHHINPRQEERFDVLWFWMAANKDLGLMVDGIDTKRLSPTISWRDQPLHAAFPIKPSEHWHLSYSVTCANAAEQKLILFVERHGDEVHATRIF